MYTMNSSLVKALILPSMHRMYKIFRMEAELLTQQKISQQICSSAQNSRQRLEPRKLYHTGLVFLFMVKEEKKLLAGLKS